MPLRQALKSTLASLKSTLHRRSPSLPLGERQDPEYEDETQPCSICANTATDNPNLCSNCQAWNDMTHLIRCKWSDYAPKEPKLFTQELNCNWKKTPMEVDKKYTEIISQVPPESWNSWTWMNEFSLDDIKRSNRSNCFICQTIAKAVETYIGSQYPGDKVAKIASWRPFPVLWWKPRGKDEQNVKDPHGTPSAGQNQLIRGEPMVRFIVLPIVITTSTQDGTRTTRLKVVELKLCFKELDHELLSVERWHRASMNLHDVKKWLNSCAAEHGDECNAGRNLAQLPQSFRLIDTQKWCVTQLADNDIRYLALSYVWAAAASTITSNQPVVQLEQGNVAQLEQPQSLLGIDLRLPALLTDAIKLSSELGYRYLWVDRLCIVQDEIGQKMDQINAMDRIYQCADLTIVAMVDHAEGLPGTAARPRIYSLANRTWQLHIKRQDTWADLPKIHQTVENSRWNTRGWTYQERVLSRRHLFISENLVYLNCPKSLITHAGDDASFEERGGYEKGIHAFNSSVSIFSVSAFSDYASAVKEYTRRKLSADTDRLNAFAGVATAYTYRGNTNMLFGLPEKFLSQALAWHPAKGTACVPWSQDGSLRPRIPSWSWAAWKGPISYTAVYWYLEGQKYSMIPSRPREFGPIIRFHFVRETGKVSPAGDKPNEFTTEANDFKLRALQPDEFSLTTHELAMQNPGSLCFNTQVSKLKLHRNYTERNDDENRGVFNVASLHELELLQGTGRDGYRDLNREYDSVHSDEGEKHLVVFNIETPGGNVIGQTAPLWLGPETPNEGSFLQKMRKPAQDCIVAVVAACRSNHKMARGSADRNAFAVMIIEEDQAERGLYRRLLTGAVDPASWKLATPEWKSIVLI